MTAEPSPSVSNANRIDWLFIFGCSVVVVAALAVGIFAFQSRGREFVNGLDEQIGELVAKQGRMAADAGRTEEALRLFDEALSASFLRSEQRVYCIQDYADLLIEAGRYDDALARIEEGLGLSANDAKLAHLRVRALQASGQLDKAVAAAAEWYRIGESEDDVEVMRAAKFGEATVHRDARHEEAALDAFLAAHKLRPGGDTALRAGRLCIQLDRTAEARTLLKYAASARDGEPAAARALLEALGKE